jgi:gluconate kinase
MIVFICGAANAGKSTVGKMLAQHLDAAFVEGDDVRKIFYNQTVEEARPQIIQAIAATVKVLAKQEDKIVVAYPVWPEDYEPLMGALKDISMPIRFIALSPSLETALTNRGTRELEDWEKVWIKESYSRGVNNPSFATIIDNSNCPPDKTLELVLNELQGV